MIRQIHLSECHSTQDILKEQLSHEISGARLLVSCENQTSGRGRGENIWASLPDTLCFSMNVPPHVVMSFTALELSVLVAKFFELKNIHLKLKWPNDLWNSDFKKCGGILIQGSNGELMAGIGLNLYSDELTYGGIFKEAFSFSKESYSKEIAEYIANNRYDSTSKLQKDWLSRCGHLNDLVTITENDEKFEGVFQGLGDYGEALVCINGQTKRLFNGSLRLPV